MVGPTSPNGSYSRGRVCAAQSGNVRFRRCSRPLVCRISADADPHHSYHPNDEDPVHREPRKFCARGDDGNHLCRRDEFALPWVGAALGFAPLPRGAVAVMLVTYATLTHVMNVWFTRRVGL